jgi:molybdenum cofactor cytidylyltransferase
MLAAGGSRRMGQSKQLLSWGNKTLVEHAADTLLQVGCRPVIAVLGHQAERVRAALGDRSLACVVNDAWKRGMGSSLQVGVTAALASEPTLDAILVTLCDQPHVDPNDLRRLLDCFEREQADIVASSYVGTRGVPAVLGRAALERVAQLPFDRGAKSLIEAGGLDVITVEVPNAARDVDTSTDYAPPDNRGEERSEPPPKE